MILDSLPTGPLEVNCYILGCEKTCEAIVIDPGGDADLILKQLEKHDLKVKYILNTHGHFDHVGGNRRLLEQPGSELFLHASDKSLLAMALQHASVYGLTTEISPEPQHLLHGGEELKLGSLTLKVLHTPGHTQGGVFYLVDELVFVGDTLFAGSIGRTDLPGGDFDQLIASIRDQLLPLVDETTVYPGHGPATTIGRERRHNPFLS